MYSSPYLIGEEYILFGIYIPLDTLIVTVTFHKIQRTSIGSPIRGAVVIYYGVQC